MCTAAAWPHYTLNPVGSDRPHRLPTLLETSPRGAAACCAPTGSPQAAWRGSRVGGERLHVNSCRLAHYTLNPVGSDLPHRLPALLETSPRGAATCVAATAQPHEC